MKKNKKFVTVSADNSFYKPYEIALEDIVEVWRYVRGILPQDYKPSHFSEQQNLKSLLADAKRSINNLEDQILKIK